MINSLVDNVQSAFIKGHSIADNIVTTEELIFSIQKGKLNGHILKVDFSKTFDMVDWGFFFNILVARRFRFQMDFLDPLIYSGNFQG